MPSRVKNKYGIYLLKLIPYSDSGILMPESVFRLLIFFEQASIKNQQESIYILRFPLSCLFETNQLKQIS